MKPAIFAPLARRDLAEAVRWIAKDNPTAAEGLRNAVAAAAARIGWHPEIGTIRRDLAAEHVRFLVLRGFLYIVVYAVDAPRPQVLRVLHGAHDLPDVLRDFGT